MAESAFRCAGLAVLALALTLSACARPVGDFGRAEITPLHDTIMPAVGNARASASGEPVSSFNLTDEEQEMRDRVWHYLVSPHASNWFGDNLVELQRTRLLPASGKGLRTERYYQWLRTERFASAQTRYARIGDDVTTDIAMMPSAFVSICAVLDIDRQRGIASNQIDGLGEKMKDEAQDRWAENRTIIGWFVAGVRNRFDSYSYALDHLLVETPHPEAVGVNGLLSDLDVYVEAAERGDFCSIGRPGGSHGETAVRSRYQRTPDKTGPFVGS